MLKTVSCSQGTVFYNIHGFLDAGTSLVKGTGNDVRRYGGISNWKGLPANVSFSL